MKKHIRDTVIADLREIRTAGYDAKLMFKHASLCGFINGVFRLGGMTCNEHTRLHNLNRAVFHARSEELCASRRAA